MRIFLGLFAITLIGCATEPEQKGWPGKYVQVLADTVFRHLEINPKLKYERYTVAVTQEKTIRTETEAGSLKMNGDTAQFSSEHALSYPDRKIIGSCDTVCLNPLKLILRGDTIYEITRTADPEPRPLYWRE